jgi:hypothetical protein
MAARLETHSEMRSAIRFLRTQGNTPRHIKSLPRDGVNMLDDNATPADTALLPMVRAGSVAVSCTDPQTCTSLGP